MFRLPHEAILRGVRKLACIKTRLYIGHCINAKYVDAKQAKLIHKYRNIKEKLLRTNASIWFNKICNAEGSDLAFIQ